MKCLSFLLTAFFLSVCTLSLPAQPIYNIKAGYHSNSLDTRIDGTQVEARGGWQVGMDARIGGGRFYWQPGLYYHRVPLRYTRVDDTGAEPQIREGSSRMQQLRIPMLLGIRLSSDPVFTYWHFRAGPEAIYAMDLKEAEHFSLDIEQARRWVPALRAELGLDILFVTLDVGYTFSLDPFFDPADGRNHSFLVTLGASF